MSSNGKVPLNSRKIEAMKPGSAIMSDTSENRGLRVSCGNGGTKTFFYRYTSPISGKLVQVKIGHFPLTSLAEARLKLQELKVARKSGRCPAIEAREEKKQEVEERENRESALTVKQLVELYLNEYIEDRFINGKLIAGARKVKGQKETRRTLVGDAVRVLGDKLASEINRKDVVKLIMEIVGRGANVQAGNVLRELTSAFEFAIGLERFDDNFANPGILAKASLRQAKVRLTSQRGKRVLSDSEIKKFLHWLPGSSFTPTQKNIMHFTIWTGCRTGEVCEAEWNDVDLVAGTWHLKDTKTGIERHVQLPTQAIAFLTQLKLTTGEYLFPSQKTGLPLQQKTLTEQAWHMRESDRMIDIKHWTPHDLRRSVRTGLARLGCRSEIAEAVLGHSKSGIEGTYDLHSYEKECREWLQIWADHLEQLLHGGGYASNIHSLVVSSN